MKIQLLTSPNGLEISQGGKHLYILPLTEKIVRITTCLKSETPAVIYSSTKNVPFSFKEVSGGLRVLLPRASLFLDNQLHLSLSDQKGHEFLEEIPYSYNSPEPADHLAEKEGHRFVGGTSYAFLKSFALSDEHFYGLGDHPGPLDHRGYEFCNWNTDDPHAHEDNFPSLYKSAPFLLVKKETGFFGVFLNNPYKTLFNCGMDEKQWFIGATGGEADFYFLLGPSAADVVSELATLIGTFPLPARWTLGYGQSRWSYANEGQVQEVVDGYAKAQIPLSAIYLDIDYMDGYRLFTVNQKRFPHFDKMVADLHKKGIKLVTILDCGVKVDSGYSTYAGGLKNHAFATFEGKTYVNEVWPGASVYPSFNVEKTRLWWKRECQAFLKHPVDGLWCDMNEPASFKGPLPNEVLFGSEKHEKIHNLYGHFMAEATSEALKESRNKRPFVITRACFLGTQRYSTVWTGDNQSIYSHLHLALPQQLNMGLSLMPFVGTDIGGFSGNCPSELMARWIEVGAFSPLFRNHSDCACHKQEAFRYPQQIQDIYRKWVLFRYRLTPYFYDLLHEEESTGWPLLRPLFFHYPEARFLNENSEFLLGEKMLVAPVLDAGATSRVLSLPKGSWYSFDMKERFLGGAFLHSCPLAETLVYVQAGAIIPQYPEGYSDLDSNPQELILRLYPGKGRYLHYQDAGDGFGYRKGEYNLYLFEHDGGKFSYHLLHEGFPKYSSLRLIFAKKEKIIAL
jgi:alpha-glucosidase